MKKLLFVIILLSGCASASPQHSEVPEEQLNTMQCNDLVVLADTVNQKAIKVIDKDAKLARSLKQIALSYYTVYAINCLDDNSEEYDSILDYVSKQQANLYYLHVKDAEIAACHNGIGM